MAIQIKLFKNLSFIIAIALIVTFALPLSVIGEEVITLTTIMPRQDVTRTKDGAIGATYKDLTDEEISDNDLVVEGKVGIGLTDPNNSIQVKDLMNFDPNVELTALGCRTGAGTRNTFVGYEVGKSNASGFENTAMGFCALNANTSGTNNTAVGFRALNTNTSGFLNTATGYRALYSNTTGYRNTAIGNDSLYRNTEGYLNTAVGAYALSFNDTGDHNCALGYYAGYSNVVGTGNVFLGYRAGYSAVGTGNVFLGYRAGHDETGSDKLYIANNSTSPLIYGDFSSGKIGLGTATPQGLLQVGLDVYTGFADNANITSRRDYSPTSPYRDYVAVFELGPDDGGSDRYPSKAALCSMVISDDPYSVAVYAALPSQAGTGSKAIYGCAVDISGNPVPGTWAGYFAGNFQVRNTLNDTTPFVIDGSGNVGIGTATPGYSLTVAGTAWCTLGAWSGSDIRWKENVETLPNPLQKVMKLKGVEFDWKQGEFAEENLPKKRQIGIIAQDLEKEFPQLVTTNEDGYKAIAYDRFTAVLLEAIKELKIENEKLEKRISALEK